YAQGNHDKTMPHEVRAAIDELGVHLLTDACKHFGEVVFGGLGSAYVGHKSDRPNMDFIEAFVKEDGYRILICHHPEYYRHYLRPYDIPLILSGHNHGGQWALFGRGLYVPGQGLFPKHTSGVCENRLVVSRGISNPTIVPRIGAPTELVILDLLKK
ncbi:MAG: serine/threonine protein phosphatase, partial [Clostridia bacterium]|nr:serine/threonine protein phosphatase [Clostridia bacterium]